MNSIIFFLLLFCTSFSFVVRGQDVPSWKITQLQQYISKADSVLVINFWATFCKPCIEELPYIQKISNEKKEEGVSLLLVSLDLPDAFPATIDSFVKDQNYYAPVVWLNETNADYFCPKIDKSWSGAIPSTLIINNRTGYRKFIEEQMSAERFEIELSQAL